MTVDRWVLALAAMVLLVLLFVGGPGYQSPRSLSAAWDLGHILAFSLWSYLLVTWTALASAAPSRQWAAALSFCLVAGAVTEGLQRLAGGDASAGDLLRDILGGVIALSWFVPPSTVLAQRLRRPARAGAAALLLVACLPVAAALIDEGIALYQFPVLSDFETPLEAGRWAGGARFAVDGSVARRGQASLRVEMDTAPYSGVSLVYFPGNWRGYRFMRMDIFNPLPEELDVTCRIHDRRHEEGDQRYDDRYNKLFHLRSGWNVIRADLADVARAPVGRSLDLGAVRCVGIFATRLPAPRTIFLDDVRLE